MADACRHILCSPSARGSARPALWRRGSLAVDRSLVYIIAAQHFQLGDHSLFAAPSRQLLVFVAFTGLLFLQLALLDCYFFTTTTIFGTPVALDIASRWLRQLACFVRRIRSALLPISNSGQGVSSIASNMAVQCMLATLIWFDSSWTECYMACHCHIWKSSHS